MIKIFKTQYAITNLLVLKLWSVHVFCMGSNLSFVHSQSSKIVALLNIIPPPQYSTVSYLSYILSLYAYGIQ